MPLLERISWKASEAQPLDMVAKIWPTYYTEVEHRTELPGKFFNWAANSHVFTDNKRTSFTVIE